MSYGGNQARSLTRSSLGEGDEEQLISSQPISRPKDGAGALPAVLPTATGVRPNQSRGRADVVPRVAERASACGGARAGPFGFAAPYLYVLPAWHGASSPLSFKRHG